MTVDKESKRIERSGIYQVVNMINQKLYIGSASCLVTRKSQHFTNNGSNLLLQRAMKKYGKESFKFEVLEYVEGASQLVAREQFWMDKARAEGKQLYNIAEVAGSQLGFKFTKESRKLMSLAKKGKKWDHVNPSKGKPRPSMKGRAAYNKGKKWPYSHPGKGVPRPLEVCTKISATLVKTWTERKSKGLAGEGYGSF